MNISFLIGLAGAFGLVVFGILEAGEIGNFIDPASILIVVGGTMFTLFATFPLKQFVTVMKQAPILLRIKGGKWDPTYYINIMTELSTEARKKGLLALEDKVAELDDAFLKDSVMLIVDAMEPDKVRSQLDNELGNLEARHAASWEFYDKGAALSPGFGMIGTLVGLINMLANMNFEEEGGAETLAANMAIALITTFYGSIMANVLFIPMGTQMRALHNEEMLCKEIVIEGVLSIQAGENPRHINEKLMGYLTRTDRDRHAAQQSAGE